jgi:hypothetical protein
MTPYPKTSYCKTDAVMNRVEKQRKPLVFRVGSDGGAPILQVITEEFSESNSVQTESTNIDTQYPEDPVEAIPEPETFVATDAVFVNRDGTMTGPFTEKELRRHWANGVIHPEDYVWKEGMSDWVVLGSYFGIPAMSPGGHSVSGFSGNRLHHPSMERSGSFLKTRLVLPLILAVIGMLVTLFLVVFIPENVLYFAVALGITLVLGLIVCLIGRSFSLVTLMMVTVLLPVLAWYFLVQNQSHSVPGLLKKQPELPTAVGEP